MLKSFPIFNISNIEQKVEEFFLYHEKSRIVESDLLRFEAEMFLCEQMVKAFNKIEGNPFE